MTVAMAVMYHERRLTEKKPLLQAEEQDRFKFSAPYFTTRLTIAEPGSSRSSSSSSHLGSSIRSRGEHGTGGLQGSVMVDLGRGLVFSCRAVTANVFLTVITIISGIGCTVVLPILTSSLTNHIQCGRLKPIGGLYVTQLFVSFWLAILFVFLVMCARLLNPFFSLNSSLTILMRIMVGFLAMCSSLLMMYASSPGRTPYILQGLATLAIIPFTLIIRRIAFRKPVSAKRLLCVLVVVLGLILSLSTVVFHTSEFHNGVVTASKLGRIVWTLLFTLAQLPGAIVSVVIENLLKMNLYEEVNSLVLMMWVQIFFFVSQLFVFFTDFIPHFGDTSSISEFGDHLADGLQCFFGSAPSAGNCSVHATMANSTFLMHPLNPDPHCDLPIARVWLYIFLYGAYQYFGLLLMKYSDGAVFLALVASLTGPCASIFWMLFSVDRRAHVHWDPAFHSSSAFILVGLILSMPAVAVYNWLSFKEAEQTCQFARYRLEL